jgi:SAM-dependent methyltransferase
MPDQQHVSCPLCGTANGAEPALAYSQPPWTLKQCRQCGMIYLENPPSYEQLETDFAWEKTFAAETTERRRRNPVLHKLGRLPKATVQALFKRDKLLSFARRYIAPGPILDVGCAGGHTLAHFPPEYIPFGIEISHELAQRAAAAFTPRGGGVVQADALTGLRQFPAQHFTGIVMTSYLEHEVHPHDALAAAKNVLRPNGRVILKVPNYASWNRHLRGAKWCGFRFPDHVNYFTPAHLKRLLADTGFRTVRFQVADHLPTSDTMWLVAEPA